jgi:hypothetical protein
VKVIPSAANAPKAAAGTNVAPEDQLLKEKRRARNPSARFSIKISGNLINIITAPSMKAILLN